MAETKVAKGTTQEKTISITKPFRKLYPWLEEIVKGLIAEAREKQQKPFLGQPLPRDPEDAAGQFIETCEELERVEKRRNELRGRLLRLWAQKGMMEIGGVKIAESAELTLRHHEALGKLTPELRAKVETMVPAFGLATFLRLADEGGIDRDLVRQCLVAGVTVSVTPPKAT